MVNGNRFAWIVIAVTAAVMTWLALTGEKSEWQFAAIAFWVVLVAAVELLPVSLGFTTKVTMGFPVYLAIALIFRHDALVAMTIVGLGAVDIREIRREIPVWRALFNRSQTALHVGAATVVLGMYRGNPLDFPAGTAIVALAAVVSLVTNLGLVATMVHVHFAAPMREAIRQLLPTPVGGFAITYVLLTGLGVVFAEAYERIGAGAVAAILIPLLFARLSIIGARAQQELSEKIRQQQEALLKATERVFQEREEERNRIAEEIHDTSLQMLAAASYGIGNAAEFVTSGHPDLAKEAADAARDAIEGAMTALRDSLMDLRKSTVQEGGLMATIEKFCDQASTLWGADVRIEGDVNVEPPTPVALAAFQILQEGLTNALKHGQSSAVTVTISGDEDGMVHIVVEDKGPGFDMETEVGEGHHGMRLMRERATRVGGRIELESSPGAGTRLEAILPGGVSR